MGLERIRFEKKDYIVSINLLLCGDTLWEKGTGLVPYEEIREHERKDCG